MSETNPNAGDDRRENVQLEYGVMIVGSHKEDDDRLLRNSVDAFVADLNRAGFNVREVKVRFGTEGGLPEAPPEVAPRGRGQDTPKSTVEIQGPPAPPKPPLTPRIAKSSGKKSSRRK